MAEKKKSTLGRFNRWIIPRLILAGISLFVAFVVAEIALSAMGFGNLVIYEWHPSLYWIPKKNQECVTKIGAQPVRINSLGTRGAEAELGKAPGTSRILCIGDSRTFGWGLAEEDTYCGLLQTRLSRQAAASGTPQIEVLNAGVNAWSFQQMQVYFEEYGAKLDPDLVIIGGANLWSEFTPDRSQDFKNSFQRRVTLKNLLRRSAVYHYVVESQLEHVYNRLKKKAVPAPAREDEQLLEERKSNPGDYLDKVIGSLISSIQKSGAKVVLLNIPDQRLFQEGQDGAFRLVVDVYPKVCARTGATYVDASKAFEQAAAGNESVYLPADPVHPNAKGAILLVDQLEPVVTGLLSKASNQQ